MNYSSFVLTEKERKPKEDAMRKSNNERAILIKEYARVNNLQKLKSNYLGMSSYYYSYEYMRLYEVSNICNELDNDINPIFKCIYDENILKLNNL